MLATGNFPVQRQTADYCRGRLTTLPGRVGYGTRSSASAFRSVRKNRIRKRNE